MHELVYLASVVLLGALAGWITARIMNLKTEFWSNVLLGIVGSFVGSLMLTFIGGSGVTGFNLYSLLVSVGGACLFTWIVRQIDGKKRKTR